jgi:hypothetical protein
MFIWELVQERKILYNSEIFINLTSFINISLNPVRCGCFLHDYQYCKKILCFTLFLQFSRVNTQWNKYAVLFLLPILWYEILEILIMQFNRNFMHFWFARYLIQTTWRWKQWIRHLVRNNHIKSSDAGALILETIIINSENLFSHSFKCYFDI